MKKTIWYILESRTGDTWAQYDGHIYPSLSSAMNRAAVVAKDAPQLGLRIVKVTQTEKVIEL